jgi:hypothetical protein
LEIIFLIIYIIYNNEEKGTKIMRKRLFENYSDNVALMNGLLAVDGSFDML